MFTLSEQDQAAQVDTRAGNALWYAWGMVDSGAFPRLELDHGFSFSQMVRDEATAYYAGQVGTLDSLLAQWRRFLQREGISTCTTVEPLGRWSTTVPA